MLLHARDLLYYTPARKKNPQKRKTFLKTCSGSMGTNAAFAGRHPHLRLCNPRHHHHLTHKPAIDAD